MPLTDAIEVRCTCRRCPLLAMCVRDGKGAYFVQIKQIKAGKITTHVLVTSGEARIQCRECFRWVLIKITKMDEVRTKQENLPEDLKLVDS
jgi:hypothetical protein